MPKRKKGHTTPHACVPINNPRRNVPSEHDQNARYRLQQSALDSFHAEITRPVFLSIGPEAKLDMFNTFWIWIWISHSIFSWTHPHLKTHHSVESSRKVRILF